MIELPDNENPDDPRWEAMVRPMGSGSEQWVLTTLRAKSSLQADAILRRAGYQTLTGSIQRNTKSPRAPMPVQVRPVACTQCGYELDGLTVKASFITCPECANPQVIVAWNDEFLTGKQHSFIVGCLATIGIIALTFFGLLILLFF